MGQQLEQRIQQQGLMGQLLVSVIMGSERQVECETGLEILFVGRRGMEHKARSGQGRREEEQKVFISRRADKEEIKEIE